MTTKSLPATAAPTALTVSQYASKIGSAVRSVGGAIIEGEVQKVSEASRSGMLYFDITDGDALLSCKVFSRDLRRLSHRPKVGELVLATVDRPDLYPQRGSLSLIVSDVQLAGDGQLLAARHALIEKLTAMGLCDQARRRPLPAFPRRVGVIAGSGSDAMSDVLTALRDRWPSVQILTHPCLVQGVHAPNSIVDALVRLCSVGDVDVIILSRGGGSVQDLVCFDNERLCRSIAACPIPVVCAIGHTDNNPVCNHVTWAAYTPSRSAELVVPSIAEIRQTISHSSRSLNLTATNVQHLGERVPSLLEKAGAGRRLDALRHEVTSTTAAARHIVTLRLEQLTSQTNVPVLAGADHLFERLQSSITNAAQRLQPAVRKSLQAAAANVTQPRDRIVDRRVSLLNQGLPSLRDQVARHAAASVSAVARQHAQARLNIAHAAALVVAHDFRPRGWALLSAGDTPVRSARDLATHRLVDVHLHDGHGRLLVEHVSQSPDPERTRNA